MVSSSYPNKTDREAQWLKIKASKKWTRKTLKVWERYFFEGIYEGKTDIDRNLLFFHPNQSIDSWQTILNSYFEVDPARWDNYYKGEALAEKSFASVAACFLGAIDSYHFHPEDRAWVFTQIFGEVYSDGLLFPLKMPGESDFRSYNVDAQHMCAPMFLAFYTYLDENKPEYKYGSLLINYLKSSIPHFSNDVFSRNLTDYGSSEFGIFVGLKHVIHWALKNPALVTSEEKEKIGFARTIKALFDNYDGQFRGYDELVSLIEQNGLQI